MSLKIEKKNEGTKDTVMLSGRLDTTTAPELDVFAEKELADTQELVLDFADLEYISSAVNHDYFPFAESFFPKNSNCAPGNRTHGLYQK